MRRTAATSCLLVLLATACGGGAATCPDDAMVTPPPDAAGGPVDLSQSGGAGACAMPAGRVVTYWPAASDKPTSMSLCDKNATSTTYDDCHLKGWLYVPEGPAHSLPAVVFVHGSGQTKNMTHFCEMVSGFVLADYVVFVPYLRGYGDSTSDKVAGIGTNATTAGAGFTNSGVYFSDDASGVLNAMTDEVDHEVQYALTFLLTQRDKTSNLPLVDSNKIALAGHSIGGGVVTLATGETLAPTPAAIVDISGGVLSWHNNVTAWDGALTGAVAKRKMPIFLFQAANESPLWGGADVMPTELDSTLLPFLAAQNVSYRNGNGGAQMAIYSAVPNLQFGPPYCVTADATSPNHCAHTTFVMDHVQVQRWLPNTLDFLAHYGVKP